MSAYLGQEDGVNLRAVLEMLQNPHPFHLSGASVDVQLAQLLRVSLQTALVVRRNHLVMNAADLQRKDVVREHDDLVAAVLMELDQKLASLKFLGVHAVQKHPLS